MSVATIEASRIPADVQSMTWCQQGSAFVPCMTIGLLELHHHEVANHACGVNFNTVWAGEAGSTFVPCMTSFH